MVSVLAQQIKRWDVEVGKGRGSLECNNAFHTSVEKSTLHVDLVGLWEKAKNISRLCEAVHDKLGEGLIWVNMYIKLAADEKTQITNRQHLLETLDRAHVLLSIDKLNRKLEAILTALDTELANSIGEFSQAITLADKAEEKFKNLGIENALSFAIAISNKGYAKFMLDEPEVGSKELLRAEKMIQKLDKVDKAQLAVIYRRLASVYDRLRKPRQAIEYNGKAKVLFDKLGSKIDSANLSFSKGNILLDVGLYDQAIDAFTDAQNIYLPLGREKELGSTFFNLGKAWYHKDNNDRASNFYEQAERILDDMHEYVELANLYTSMGILYENQETEDDYLKAKHYYEKAENLYNTYSKHPQEYLRTLAINKGKLYERWGKYKEANVEYLLAEKQISTAREQERLVIYNNLAYIALLSKDYDCALAYAQKALQGLDQTLELELYLGGTPSLQFIDQHLSHYIAVEALIQKGDIAKAYAMRQASRNRLFHLMWRMKADGKSTEQVKTLWQKKLEIERKITEIEHRAVESQSENERSRLLSTRNELKKKKDAEERELIANPELDKKIFAIDPLDVDKLQTNLKPDEALIDYQVSKEFVHGYIRFRIDAFIVKHGGVKYARLFTDRDAIESLNLVKEYTDLQRPQMLQNYYSKGLLDQYKQKNHAAAKILYQDLFEKLAGDLVDIEKIFIIPDGPLNLLPFETLRDHQDKLLLEKYVISYLNSPADVYRNYAKSNQGLLVFGDIDYGSELKGMREWSNIAGSAEALMSITKNMQKKMPVTYVQKTEATESHFKQLSPGHEIMLIWSHGEFSNYNKIPEALIKAQDDIGGINLKTIEEFDAWNTYEYRKQFNDPLSNSFVAFAAINKGGDGRNDGYLTAREVMGLNLQGTELTILAACETGVGQSSPSEGVLGLRKAFSIAGSRQLLISLWQVDADWTKELIKAMLNNYEEQGGARALNNAKKALIEKLREKGREPFPFYWAGFILVGKGK